MAATNQQSAIEQANELIGLANSFRDLRSRVTAYMRRYTSTQPDAIWQELATAAYNADGSIGSTDDEPNNANPITVEELHRSRNQLINGVTMLEQFQNFLDNEAVTQGDRNTVIDQLA